MIRSLSKCDKIYYSILGILDFMSQAATSLTSGLNTYATNALQCLDQGPQILYTPLDFELPKPVSTTTVSSNIETEKVVSGITY